MSQELRSELHELTRAFRVWAEFADDVGTLGLPSGGPTGRRGEQAVVGPSHAATAHEPLRTAPAGPASAPRPPEAPPAPLAHQVAPAPASAPRLTPAMPVPAPPPARPRPSVASADDGLPPEERRHRLAVIAEQVSTCRACVLHEGRHHTVFARGNDRAELVFVGEGPGAEEDLQGLPFVGKAGQLLDRMIEAMGYRPEEVYIANVVKCRPPNNRKPEPMEMASCLPFLNEQLELVSPRAIVALGATATEGLLGMTGITRLRGTWRLWRGRVPVMPTFHPSYLLRNPAAKREVWEDLKKVLERLGRTPPPPRNRSGG